MMKRLILSIGCAAAVLAASSAALAQGKSGGPKLKATTAGAKTHGPTIKTTTHGGGHAKTTTTAKVAGPKAPKVKAATTAKVPKAKTTTTAKATAKAETKAAKKGSSTTTSTSGTQTGTTTTTDTAAPLTKVQEKLQKNTNLASKLESRLPAGTDLMTAAEGFRNLGQFVAAVNVSNNLGLDFTKLKIAMVDDGMSLGQAIQAQRSTVDATGIAATAQRDAETLIQSTEPTTTVKSTKTKARKTSDGQ